MAEKLDGAGKVRSELVGHNGVNTNVSGYHDIAYEGPISIWPSAPSRSAMRPQSRDLAFI